MHRVLLEIGPVTLYTYGLALAVSFIVGIWLCARRAEAYGFTRAQVHDSAIPVLLAGLLGAKLMYLGTNWEDVSRDWRFMLSVLRGGFVYYGGVAGGTLGAIWWLKRRRLPILAFGDVIAPGMGVALAIGRLGCWLNGCCYGTPVAWGWVLPGLGDAVSRHPVQLYEAAGSLTIGLALLFVPTSGSKTRPVDAPTGKRGRVFALFLISYAVLRFALEFLRDDPRGPVLAGLSVSQFFSVIGASIGLVLLFRPLNRRSYSQ